MKHFKEKKNEAEGLNWYFVLESALCGMIVLTIILDLSTLTSIAFLLSFLVVLLHFGKLILRGFTKIVLCCIFLLLLSLAAVCISTLKFNIQLSFEYLKEYVLFVSTIIYLCIAAEETINQRTTAYILKFNLIIACIYPIAYFTVPDITSNIGLHMHFTNTNLTGMWLLQSVLFSCIGFVALKSGWKLLSLITGLFNIYFVILTNARNSYLALALFFVLFVWNLLKQKSKYSKLFVILLLLLPLIFVPLYFWLINPISEIGWLNFLVSEGKQLDSRLIIWNRVIRYLNARNSWFSGNYPYLQGNLHNSYMVVLGSYGVLTLTGVAAYLIYIVCQVNDRIKDSFGKYCLAGFFAGMFLGIGEGAYFSGGVGLNLVITVFLFLARGNPDMQQMSHPEIRRKRISKYIK